MTTQPPGPQGLYDPRDEHDACGIGFVADLKRPASRHIVERALSVLDNLAHRGATGADPATGDGAGILLQIPHAFFARVLAPTPLPPPGRYGVAMLFVPRGPEAREHAKRVLTAAAAAEGLHLIAWRDVPTGDAGLGDAARASQPHIVQAFLHHLDDLGTDELERRLYVARRRVEREARNDRVLRGLYAASMSCRTIVYKGMLTPAQLRAFYPDLQEPDVASRVAMVHSRFSTNTFPNWARAHPYRLISHNGEINTLRANVNWMRAREPALRGGPLGARLASLSPLLDEDGSDSAILDNALEFLTLNGYTLPEALFTLVPAPWEQDAAMPAPVRAFYEHQSLFMEPWDGPADVAFTDGRLVGAILDRNGLRPGRYWVTRDGLVVFSSETGVVDTPPHDVLEKGRLRPGHIFLVDLAEGRIIGDEEAKERVAARAPYRARIDAAVSDLPTRPAEPAADPTTDLDTLHRIFGYSNEDLNILIPPMATTGNEAIGSMGTDTPLAVLSRRPQPLYNYFKQVFAQVTNPPLDAIREELVVSTRTLLGAHPDLLAPHASLPSRVRLDRPVVTNHEWAHVMLHPSLRTRTLALLYDPEAPHSLRDALHTLQQDAEDAVRHGVTFLALSDRGADARHAPIPALLATASIHHHLIRRGLRTRVSLGVETGDAREVHHVSLLIGFGASIVYPYLALDTIRHAIRHGRLPEDDPHHAQEQFVKAATKGVVKVMSKMGVSTIQSYHGSQLFEAIGLGPQLIAQHFTGTASRLGGLELDDVARESLERHRLAFPHHGPRPALASGGEYQYRRDGQPHLFNPETVHRLQHACRTGDTRAYQEYARQVNDQDRDPCTLRSLLEFTPGTPVPLEEVEPVDSIVRRFRTGAMSYGSISQEAHETLAIAMNRLGGKSNTGEGGEDPARYTRDPNGDSRNSAIKQVASGRFGVTSEYLVHARELQIKIAQGAKPGEGGQLPGSKVYPWIAKVRHATPGVGLISPPPHHDIYSIEDLAQLIHDLKDANPQARVSVKLVAEAGVGTIAAGVAKARADGILISGHDGGTGASPLTAIKHAGVPWELGLAEAHQVLLLNGLRSRVVLETDGQLKTGRDVVIAALLGAEEFGFATAPLVALGCVMMRACHLNTCPVGVATQDPQLRKRFQGDPQHVVNFMRFIAQDVREWMARLGFRTVDEMVGATDRLRPRTLPDHPKAATLDLTPLLHASAPATERHHTREHEPEGGAHLDREVLLPLAAPALQDARPVYAQLPIRNQHRSVGTLLSSEITRRHGAAGLPAGTIELRFLGSAGQSFGAFATRGLTMILEGDANDYLGKGLCGATLILHPPADAGHAPGSTIAGNVAFYGATSGAAYIRGAVGERFAVRNSGLEAVVEGVGDHGLEYMTGGRVVVLGPTGRNFAAGMSGGIAFVLDDEGSLAERCNRGMVGLGPVREAEELTTLHRLLERHAQFTGSEAARAILADWPRSQSRFTQVTPNDYERALAAQRRLRSSSDAASLEMAAFEENAHSVARVGGS